MAKNKNGNIAEAKEVDAVETVDTVETKEVVDTTKETKSKKVKEDSNAKSKDSKDSKKSKKNPNKKNVAQKSKELYSELKKVSWPSFGKVVRSTGVVLLVVAICTLILFGADRLFYWIFNLLMG